MRVLHFDCFSGISGDMTLGALFDAGVPTQPVLDGIASLGLPIQIDVEKIRKGGFAATQVHVEAPDESEERHLPEIEAIITRGNLTEKQRELALKIFRRLAEAEATAHGMTLERIHFHEVGALDSIADIVGAAIAIDLLGAERITSTAVPTGTGTVKCAHGVMPVPTPGTAVLLVGVPLRPSSIKAELTTPTGAAILTTVVQEWTDAPALTIERIGHGAGTKDFLEQPNILRVFVGKAPLPLGERGWGEGPPPVGLQADVVWLLETNLDDVPGEIVGYCFERLLAGGALDVFTTPIQMKKQRPALMLSVLAPADKLSAVEDILFQETGTLGIRRQPVERHKLHREEHVVETPWGPVRGKLGWREGEPPHFSPEYEDCARIARAEKVALREVYAAASRAYRAR